MTSTTNRRALLGAVLAGTAVGATSFPALASPELSAAEDPIFEAIAKHKAAYVDYLAAIKMADWNAEGEDPTQAAASDVESAAMEAMLEIGPSTLAGARAFLQHLANVENGCLPQETWELVECLANSPLFAEDADLVLAEEEDA
jgi:hypothetical protein